MRYLFVLGRNIELSVEEIKAFLEKEGIRFKIISIIKNGILIDAERILRGVVDKLGGTISVGEVITTGSTEKILADLDSKPIYNVRKNKLNYVIHDFNGKDFERISFYLKNRFRREELKATEKNLTGRIKLQTGKEIPKVSSSLIDEQYFVFADNFGKIMEETDYEKIEKRDMGKPARRSELSISPRLAKILINLSKVRQGEILLDPFCGVGTILQEALLQDVRVIGIDKDRKAADAAGLNLKWFDFPKEKYQLINGDSSKINLPNIVNAIATEPDLGELQKKMPTEQKAMEIIKGFENLIVSVIKNLKKNVRQKAEPLANSSPTSQVKGRIVFTAPLILAGKKRVSANFKSIALKTNLNIVKGFPIDEFREDSIVGRSVVVLEN